MPFLQANPLVYNCRPHSQKGQSGIDLAILSGNDVAVIIEAKIVGSKDMITAHDLNRKAFHEAIFYFMQERERGNDKLTHIVITDFYDWFVFDAKDFDRLFWRNDQLKKTFHAYHDPNLLTRSTAEVYAAIEAELPKKLKDLFTEVAIDCAYFNVAAPHSIKDKELIAIYKLLSPDCLLKAFNPNDANSLNREFYNELLYILGLEEIKDGGKRLISAAGTAGGLYDGIADKLDQQGKPHAFEDVIKLIIIWINRVLFLKLLESQIVTWTGDKTSRFLSADKISGYDGLENLFFDTLARRVPDRTNKSFAYIPYLNSSLFEMQDEEKAGIGISALSDSTQIAYYAKTVVKDAATKRKSGKANTLAYLFEFLDAYDFANDSGDEVVAETKTLISASVLGLIFEKINGYKDGSFYTPSFVTMYMARQTIEKAVLQKFNEKYGWTCTALTGDGGLKNEIKDHKVKKQDSNALIDSLKICDPAVGSGHFLVSALNEILYIKSVLGLLVDEAGNMLDYNISIENDELIVTSDEGELFEYKKGSKEKTLVQKTLFQEKQKIIENCLFGVDINPNSVNIFRLRLWIELLKNAYYQPDGALETLPNIDINIKCGNSLISRFALDTNLKDALKKSKISVNEYRTAVSNYRNTSDKTQKRQIESLIADIKSKFRKDLQTNDPNLEKLKKAQGALRMLEGQDALFEEDDGKKKEKRKLTADLKNDITKYITAIEDIKSNKIYRNAFEWRLEFPEVLDELGNFIGFDVMIGNPPYIQIKDIEWDYRKHFEKEYAFATGRFNIFYLFIETSALLTAKNGISAYIVPDRLLLNTQCNDLRKWLLNEQELIELISFGGAVFESAVVDSIICLYRNSKIEDGIVQTKNMIGLNEILKSEYVSIPLKHFKGATDSQFNLSYSTTNNFITKKIKDASIQLSEISETKDGIIQGKVADKLFIKVKIDSYSKKILFGENITKYKINYQNNWVNYKPEELMKIEVERRGEGVRAGLWMRNPKIFEREKILTRQTADEIIATLDSEHHYYANTLHGTTIIDSSYSVYYVLAILNSKLITWYYRSTTAEEGKTFAQIKIEKLKTLPIKKALTNEQLLLAKLATQMLAIDAPKTDDGLKKLMREIDDMVYKLYGLTYDEVKTIEPEYSSMSRDEYEALV